MLLNTIYEHSIDKQDLMGILNTVLCVKWPFDVWLPICYVCYINFSAFYILIYTLNGTFNGHFYLFQNFFCVFNRYYDSNLSEMELILSAYVKRLYQIVKAY